MRATLHLVSTRDYLRFHPALADAIRRKYRRPDDDASELAKLGGQFESAAQEPRASAELRALVEPERWFRVLAHARLLRVGEGFVAAEPWLGLPYEPPTEGLRHLLRRYLAAWGPATAADAAAWTGLPVGGLRAALEWVGTRTFRDERDRTLYDLPRAPLPPVDATAPSRLLPRFDNVILSHADRTRVIADEHRKLVIRAGEVDPVVLVDGVVAGRWRRKGKRVEVEWFGAVTRTRREEVEDEARRLEAFLSR
jgi:hypothetical protein